MSAIGFCALAAFSWHVVEKPIHRRRRDIVAAVDRMFAGVIRRLPGSSA